MQQDNFQETPEGIFYSTLRHHRHASSQRFEMLRFALSFLFALALVLVALLLLGAMPWVCVGWAALVGLSSISFVAMDLRLAAHQRRLNRSLATQGSETSGDPDSQKDNAVRAPRTSVENDCAQWDAWPACTLYLAFALFGLFCGALPFWRNVSLMKPPTQAPTVREIPAVNVGPIQPRLPLTPIPRPPIGNYHTPPPFSGSFQASGTPPYTAPALNRPPSQTPAKSQ